MKRKNKKPLKKIACATRRCASLSIVPSAKNHHRPHLVRRYGLLFILALVLSIQFAYNLSRTGSILGQETDITTEKLLASTNDFRSHHNLGKLTISPQLSQAASLKAQDMFKYQYWAHDNPNGVQPWHWFEEVGYKYSVAGENLAKDFHTSGGVVTGWMRSEEHRKNMLDSRFQNVGFAVMPGQLKGSDTMLVVALYGTPQSEVAASSSSTPTVLAAQQNSHNIVTRLGVGVQQLNPAVLGSITILLVAAGVAFLAHLYRYNLPKARRQSWYRYHGLYKSFGLLSLAIILVILYGSGGI